MDDSVQHIYIRPGGHMLEKVPTDPLDTFMGCGLSQHLRMDKQNAAAGWEGIQDISQLDAQAAADVSDDRESAPVIRVVDCWRSSSPDFAHCFVENLSSFRVASAKLPEVIPVDLIEGLFARSDAPPQACPRFVQPSAGRKFSAAKSRQ